MAAAVDDLNAALDLIGREYCLSRDEVRERLVARPAKAVRSLLPAPVQPAEGEPWFLRLWRRELIERVFVALDAASLARLVRVSRWPLENSTATLRRLVALIGLDEAASRQSARRFEMQMLLRLVRTRELVFHEKFDSGWQTQWPAASEMVKNGFTAQTVTHNRVQCGELVHSADIAHCGLKRAFAAPGLTPSAVCVKLCAPAGLEDGKGAGYFALGGNSEEAYSVFCYFKCGMEEHEDEDEESDEFEVGELSLVLVTDRNGMASTVALVRHVTPGRWYDLRFEMDWEAKQMNVSVDGLQLRRGCRFYNSGELVEPSATCIRNIKLHNFYTDVTARWADIKFYP